MKNAEIISIISVLIALFVIATTILSDLESSCQSNVIFLIANNTEFFYRSLLFSNSFITSSLFNKYFNQTNNNLSDFGSTFNSLQAQSIDFREQVSKKIEECSKLKFLKNLLFILQLSGSLVILFLTLKERGNKK